MEVIVSRDSVAAGDDVDAPHTRRLQIQSTSPKEFATQILRAYPLPLIGGGHATWVVSSGVPLAVVAQQWQEPRLLKGVLDLANCDRKGETTLVHVSYLAQIDPSCAAEVLDHLRLRC